LSAGRDEPYVKWADKLILKKTSGFTRGPEMTENKKLIQEQKVEKKMREAMSNLRDP